MDAAEIVPQPSGGSGPSMRVRWIAPPSGTDWVLSGKVTTWATTHDEFGAGLAVLVSGTVASPTLIRSCMVGHSGSTTYHIGANVSWSSYTSTTGTSTYSTFGAISPLEEAPFYLQIRYDSTGDTVTMWISQSGRMWRQIGSAHTGVTDPVRVGFFAHDKGTVVQGRGLFDWVRLRTDAAGLVGETGE